MAKQHCSCCEAAEIEKRLYTKFVVNGVLHAMPQMWLVGATRNMSHHDALLYWVDQCTLLEARNAQ